MTQEELETKLTPTNELEETDMAVIPCVGCGAEHVLVNRFEPNAFGNSPHYEDVIRGTLTCGERISDPERSDKLVECGYQTFFVIKGNVSTFLPGKLLRQDLGDVHKNARTMIDEAAKCLYGGSAVGAVALCRSAVSEEILGKDVGTRKDMMPSLLQKAKNAGLVTPTDEAHIDAARLGARDALHYMGDVTEDDAVLAIRSAVRVINDISTREPLPASQSKKGSNAT